MHGIFRSMKDYAPLPLRLIIGWRLVAGVWDAAFGFEEMQGVITFFGSLGLPAPSVSAFLAVYAELICGLLFIVGLWIRQAAVVMVFTFLIAIALVDIHSPITKSFAAWIILAGSVSLLCSGAGKLSIDDRICRISPR